VNNILDAKETIYLIQQRALSDPGIALLQVALNMPGGFSLYPWEQLFLEAVAQVKNCLQHDGIIIHSEEVLYTAVGPYCMLAVRADSFLVKQLMVKLEEQAPHGRLWDLDLLTSQGPVDRATLGRPPRACLVCHESAHVCRKLGHHLPTEIITAAQRIATEVRRGAC